MKKTIKGKKCDAECDYEKHKKATHYCYQCENNFCKKCVTHYLHNLYTCPFCDPPELIPLPPKKKLK